MTIKPDIFFEYLDNTITISQNGKTIEASICENKYFGTDEELDETTTSCPCATFEDFKCPREAIEWAVELINMDRDINTDAPIILVNRNPERSRYNKNNYRASDSRHRDWTIRVKMRDGDRCVECGKTNNLHAHHIKPYKDFPELRYDLSNGKTLCRSCHKKTHEAEVAL